MIYWYFEERSKLTIASLENRKRSFRALWNKLQWFWGLRIDPILIPTATRLCVTMKTLVQTFVNICIVFNFEACVSFFLENLFTFTMLIQSKGTLLGEKVEINRAEIANVEIKKAEIILTG